MIKQLEWDSSFFQLKVGEVNIDEDDLENAGDFDLIYAKTVNNTKPIVSGFETTFSENKIVFNKILRFKSNVTVDVTSLYDNSGNDVLYELGFESGKYSRFKLDPGFEDKSFRDMYKLWIDNSLNRKFADDFIVCKDGDVITGFATYKIKYGVAQIGLIAVLPTYQGRGIGAAILTSVENDLLDKGVKELRIPTQENNITACSFYKKRGYKVIEKAQIIHYWKK